MLSGEDSGDGVGYCGIIKGMAQLVRCHRFFGVVADGQIDFIASAQDALFIVHAVVGVYLQIGNRQYAVHVFAADCALRLQLKSYFRSF